MDQLLDGDFFLPGVLIFGGCHLKHRWSTEFNCACTYVHIIYNKTIKNYNYSNATLTQDIHTNIQINLRNLKNYMLFKL